jgi:urease accessory protein
MNEAAAAAIGVWRDLDRPARAVEAALSFARRGGRTILAAQRVPYPFHVTRVFHLDAQCPHLATLYLQSASGGLYRGDRLALDVHVASGAAAHLTTQSATIVHAARGCGARQTTRITVEHAGFVAFTPDPLVLFPGSAVSSTTEITLCDGAAAIVTDGFASHDPEGGTCAFERYAVSAMVRDERGRVLISDRGSVSGDELSGSASPLGPHRAAGTVLLLGRGSDRLDAAELQKRLDAVGCLAGIGALPNGAGVGGRILAFDGGTLRRGLDVAFGFAFEALLGVTPVPRRK